MLLFDIGANVGAWAKANVSSASKIVSVEADPRTFATLVEQTKGYPVIECVHAAITSAPTSYITFYRASSNTLSTLNREWLTSPSSRFAGTPFEEIQCPTRTIDSLVDQYGVPDLLKIDVEGAEYEVLKSLTRPVPLLCFEWASETSLITEQCLNYLIELGYTNFDLQFRDSYTYYPDSFESESYIKEMLKKMTPREEWGMIWAKYVPR